MRNEINWRGINLNLLLTFSALIKQRSVTRAAEQLHISQSAMSYNLNQLRTLLNDPLFERQGHSMVPTRHAEFLAPKVQHVLNMIEHEILQADTFNPPTSKERLIIGLSDYAELVFGPLIYDVFSQEAPDCPLIFQAVDSGNCYQSLEQGNVDLAIGVYYELPEALERTPLYRERHVCLFDNSAMQTALPISLKTYLDTPHAVVTATGKLTTAVGRILAGMGKERRVVLGSSRFLTLRHVLSGRKLLCVMAEMMAKMPLFNDQLTISQPPVPILDFDVEMVIRKRDSQNPRIAWLRECIGAIIQQHVAEIKAPG